jgi:hypothetical protein
MDILYAITQLIPRILEQSLLSDLIFNLNGKNKLVRLMYTKWDKNTLLLPVSNDKMAKSVEILTNNKLIRVVDSIEKAITVLGVSRNTGFKYMNHVKGFYSPYLKEIVNIKHPHIETLLTHKIIYRKEEDISELSIPNVSLNALTLNLLYVYNSEFSLVGTYKSIVEAARNLNPNSIILGTNLRGKEIAISRAKNKSKLVDNEKGSFYFAENPSTNRWTIYQKGKYPLQLVDIINNEEKEFIGIRTVQSYLFKLLKVKPDYKTIKSHYNKGTVYKKQFKFVPINKTDIV